jgi:hypothetical protein
MDTARYRAIGLVSFLSMLLIASLLFGASNQAAQAATGIHYVAPGGSCGGRTPCYSTVQAAVDAAQPGDEIRVAAGTYSGINNQGGLAQVVYIAKSLTIRGGFAASNWNTPNPDTNITELLAAGQGRVVVITGEVDVTLEGIRLSYGNAAGLGGHKVIYDSTDAGGGLYISQADVTLDEITIYTSTVSDGNGGGLYQTGGTLLVENSTLQGNYAFHGGGAYFYESEVTFTDNLVQGNTINDFTGNGSGLMTDGGTVLISENILQNNLTDQNVIGAAGFNDIDLTITNNQIRANEGTAISLGYTISPPYIAGNIIQGNGKHGIYLIYTSAIVSNNTIKDNGATGIYSQGDLQIIGNLIQNNQSGQFGGGVHILLATPKTLIANNIIRDNRVGGGLIWNGSGGGMYLDRCNEVPLIGNLFAGNQAFNSSNNSQPGKGGGLYLTRSDVIMTNNIIVNNYAQSSGSGMYISGSSPTLLHTTIANNTGGNGTGILAIAVSTDPSVLNMKNTIVVSQTIGVAVDSGSPQNLATLDGVLWWANGANKTGTAFIFHETTGDPAFVDPSSDDFHISPTSAAIDNGIDTDVTLDFDSEPRFVPPDLGADEFWLPDSLRQLFLPLIRRD